MILHQEADEIAYRCAFACQRQGYKVIKKDKVIDLKDEMTKTEIVAKLADKGGKLDVNYTLEPYPIIEPEYIVDFTVDRMVEKLHELDTPEFGKIKEVNLWLSPGDHSNFRYNVANIVGGKGVGYKAGRPPKPHWLAHIRERLIHKWDAQEIFGFEADDALGMFANSGTVLSHIDKDINMVPGWHYNHVTGEVYKIEDGLGTLIYEDKALKKGGLIFFYAQLIMGDSTDNIPGIKKAGPKKAYDLLKTSLDEEEAYNVVRQLYVQQYGDRALEALYEVADLIWMCRKKDETGRQYLQSRGFENDK